MVKEIGLWREEGESLVRNKSSFNWKDPIYCYRVTWRIVAPHNVPPPPPSPTDAAQAAREGARVRPDGRAAGGATRHRLLEPVARRLHEEPRRDAHLAAHAAPGDAACAGDVSGGTRLHTHPWLLRPQVSAATPSGECCYALRWVLPHPPFRGYNQGWVIALRLRYFGILW